MKPPVGVPMVVFALALALMTAALVLWVLAVDEPFTADIVLFPLAYLAFGLIGALILGRHPRHPIGLLGLVVGTLGSLIALLDSYARIPSSMALQDWAAWGAAVGNPMSLGLILLLLLLFPTGRLPSPRWLVVGIPLVAGIGIMAVGNALSPTFADYPFRNPIGVAAIKASPIEHGGIGWFAVLFAAVAVPVGLVIRLRAARGIQRQQLKWVQSATALHAVAWLVFALDLPGAAGQIALYGVFGTLALIPVAAGIAILRYRLYDIDVVIRRTLVYGAVVAVLAATYVGLVLVLQTALSQVTGGDTLPVALSTLAIAALFGPVRARVRAWVDRRFYRSRYDAQRTVEGFAARLRDEVELEAVGAALVAVADQAVQPSGARVWIRGGVGRGA